MTVEQGVTSESPPAEIHDGGPEHIPAPPITSDVVEADPSGAKDESLLDAVKSALKPKTDASSASKDGPIDPAAPKTTSEDEEKEPDADPTQEELDRYHSKTRKQVRRLLSQRNEAMDQVKELTPAAEYGRKIDSFIKDSGMSATEANLLLDVGRNMKRDPLKAWEQLKPYVTALSQMAGESLPADLKADVDAGKLAREHAAELARTRTANAVSQAELQRTTAANTQRDQEANVQAHASAVGNAVSAWETRQAGTDLDWNQKQPRIMELVELEIRRSGYPKTTAAAVQMSEAAKTKVDAEFARFSPRKLPIGSDPASNTRVVLAAPKTPLEAARQALAAQ